MGMNGFAEASEATAEDAARPAGPYAIVIFGAGGDLTRRLVVPALYNLMAKRLLAGEFPPSPNVGYETLIYDCMIGDPSLFRRADMVEEGWRIVQPVLDAWATEPPVDFPNYRAGSAGPGGAEKLLTDDGGRAWRPIAHHNQGTLHAIYFPTPRRRRWHIGDGAKGADRTCPGCGAELT